MTSSAVSPDGPATSATEQSESGTTPAILKTTEPAPDRSLQAVTLMMAIACGLTVANLYYAQPLLDLIAGSLHIGQGTAAVVVTATQFGYAIGLAFVLPLGDLLENRKLASLVLIGTSVALVAAALAPGLSVFLVASVLVGTTSVVAQILVPFAAHLAPPEQRGRIVGRVMGGLLLGILLARTVASLAAEAWGWRSIYLISAAAMLVISVLLLRILPERRPEPGLSYRKLLTSLGELVRTEPVLRRRALSQALMFGAFSAFWTAIAYELIDEHHLGQLQIAIFALIGAGGALAAPVAGRLGDRGLGHPLSAVVILIGCVAMVLGLVGSSSVILLAVAGVLLDLAVQGHQVFSQRDIYALREDARARITTVFMCSVFAGGAISSAIAGVLHGPFGWKGVAAFGAALPVLAFGVWLRGHLVARRPELPRTR